jgi:resuscitation-promoting factor RpfB
MTRALTVAALTVALLAPTVAEASVIERRAENVAQRASTVTVKAGDTLAGIAEGSGFVWERWAWVNRDEIPDPDLIVPGQRLKMPRRDGKRWVPPRPAPAVSRSVGTAPASVKATGGSVGGLNWSALAACESGGNPRAVSPSGKYRGAFQFDLATWRSVGMSGDPIAYPYSVQLAAAQRLYASRGRSPWPHCGRLL